jgi:hypothetical protein
MEWNLRRMLPGIATALVSMTDLVSATNGSQIRSLENRVTALEQRRGASGMVNPPANPTVKHGADLFVFGELLYWKANENGLPLGVVNKNTSLNLSDAKIENIHGKWDVGCRVGVGYIIPHDGWDLDLTWLHFNTKSHKKTLHSSSKRFIFPTLAPSSDPIADDNFCTKADGRWKLRLNQLDLDLGREFFVSKWLTLRPHAGLRVDWLKQKLSADYKNFDSGLPPPNEVDVRYKDRWWGIGIESGLDTQWGLGCGWSIFANFAAAILYGNHSIKFKDENTPPVTNGSNGATSLPKGKYAGVREHIHHVAHPILDLQLGLRWDWMFDNDHFHLGLQAGWEDHVYFSQNQFPIFSDDYNFGKFFANQGDLAFQGWTFGARFDF